MTAEGQTIREALNQIGPGWDMGTKYQTAMEALTALEARLAEADEELAEWKLEAERRGLPKELIQRLHKAERALRDVQGAAGHPDAAEACRNILKIARAALPPESGTS